MTRVSFAEGIVRDEAGAGNRGRAARISVQSLGFILRGQPLKGLEPGREVTH